MNCAGTLALALSGHTPFAIPLTESINVLTRALVKYWFAPSDTAVVLIALPSAVYNCPPLITAV
jgi:hypothetical protein